MGTFGRRVRSERLQEGSQPGLSFLKILLGRRLRWCPGPNNRRRDRRFHLA